MSGKLNIGKGRLNVGGGGAIKVAKLALPGQQQVVTDAPLEERLSRELSDAELSFNARRKQEDQRMKDATDAEFWVAFYFQSRAQKEAFLTALRLIDLGDKYVEGQEAARRLRIALPPGPRWQTRERSPRRLLPLVGGPKPT